MADRLVYQPRQVAARGLRSAGGGSTFMGAVRPALCRSRAAG